MVKIIFWFVIVAVSYYVFREAHKRAADDIAEYKKVERFEVLPDHCAEIQIYGCYYGLAIGITFSVYLVSAGLWFSYL